MLVIRRRPGEVLLIGEDIEIEVLDASASQVKLGIRAPRQIPVARKEILLVGALNRAASQQVEAGALERVVSALNKRNSSPPLPVR